MSEISDNTSEITLKIKKYSNQVFDIFNGENTSFSRLVLKSVLNNLENKSVLTK